MVQTIQQTTEFPQFLYISGGRCPCCAGCARHAAHVSTTAVCAQGWLCWFRCASAVFLLVVAGQDLPHLDRCDQKDSCCGMYKAGIAGDYAPCAVFVSLVGRPRMLVILADMDQEDSCSGMTVRASPEVFRKIGISWEINCYFLRPLVCGSQLFGTGLPEECVRRFFWEITSGMVSVFSASRGDSGYMFCVISRRLHGEFSYFLCEGGTLDPGHSRFFLHTCPMRKWPRSLSFRQWHGYCWFADEIAPRAVFPSSLAGVHQVRRQIPVVVQRLIPMILVTMGIPQLQFIEKVFDDPVMLLVRVHRCRRGEDSRAPTVALGEKLVMLRPLRVWALLGAAHHHGDELKGRFF